MSNPTSHTLSLPKIFGIIIVSIIHILSLEVKIIRILSLEVKIREELAIQTLQAMAKLFFYDF